MPAGHNLVAAEQAPGHQGVDLRDREHQWRRHPWLCWVIDLFGAPQYKFLDHLFPPRP